MRLNVVVQVAALFARGGCLLRRHHLRAMPAITPLCLLHSASCSSMRGGGACCTACAIFRASAGAAAPCRAPGKRSCCHLPPQRPTCCKRLFASGVWRHSRRRRGMACGRGWAAGWRVHGDCFAGRAAVCGVAALSPRSCASAVCEGGGDNGGRDALTRRLQDALGRGCAATRVEGQDVSSTQPPASCLNTRHRCMLCTMAIQPAAVHNAPAAATCAAAWPLGAGQGSLA